MLLSCRVQAFEFDGIPRAWIEPINNIVDELWVPSQYNREIYTDDGVSDGKVKVLFLQFVFHNLSLVARMPVCQVEAFDS